MMRARVLGLACVLGLVAGAARAQNVYLGHAPTDSVLGIMSAAPMTADVRLGGGNYMQRAYLTLHYDPAALHVLGALGVPGDSIIGIDSSHAGALALTLDGCMYGGDAAIARLKVQLDAAASTGTMTYLTVDSASNNNYYCSGTAVPAYWSSAMTSLCTATTVYGDVDNSLAVDSRDALITLSAAVGLPVSGFALQNGDVDGDGLVNSRDALLDLSYAIGLSTGTARVGLGIPVACPANAPAGEYVALRVRNSGYNDSVGVLTPSASVPSIVPNTVSSPLGPRLAADSVSVVYTCAGYYQQDICRIRSDGSAGRVISQGYYDGAPDWKPQGDSIAYRRTSTGYIAVMDSSGDSLGTKFRILTANVVASSLFPGSVAWNRTGSAIAYVKSDGTLWTVHTDSSADAQITGVTDAVSVRWSPAGDSLAFTRYNEPGIWVVAAAGGTPAVRTSFRRYGNVTSQDLGFDWGPQGIIFASEEAGRMGLWLLSPSGTLSRVTSGPHIEPSWRRNP